MTNGRDQADELIRDAEQHLLDVDPAPLSPKAFQLLRVKISAYVRELIVESSRVARRRQSDTVSAAHIEFASDYLVTGTSRRWWRHVGTLGGMLLGAAISNFLSMLTTGKFTANGVLISAVLGIVGAFGVAFQIGRE